MLLIVSMIDNLVDILLRMRPHFKKIFPNKEKRRLLTEQAISVYAKSYHSLTGERKVLKT